MRKRDKICYPETTTEIRQRNYGWGVGLASLYVFYLYFFFKKNPWVHCVK